MQKDTIVSLRLSSVSATNPIESLSLRPPFRSSFDDTSSHSPPLELDISRSLLLGLFETSTLPPTRRLHMWIRSIHHWLSASDSLCFWPLSVPVSRKSVRDLLVYEYTPSPEKGRKFDKFDMHAGKRTTPIDSSGHVYE